MPPAPPSRWWWNWAARWSACPHLPFIHRSKLRPRFLSSGLMLPAPPRPHRFALLWRLFRRACFAAASTPDDPSHIRPFLARALLLWSPPSHGSIMIGIVLV